MFHILFCFISESIDYVQQSAIPMQYETHSGEDVAIYATGPWSHLYQKVHEENYIPHVMSYAACISQLGKSSAHCQFFTNSSSHSVMENTWHLQAIIWASICIMLCRFN